MKILILGSMSFSPEMREIADRLRNRGLEVTLPEFIEDYLGCKTREEMHARAVQNKLGNNLYKVYHDLISQQDRVLIVNKTKKGIENYVGPNTFAEMCFARALEKQVYLLHPIPAVEYADEIRAIHPIILNEDLTLIK